MSDAARQNPGHACPQCGAIYQQTEDSCAERFPALLALDNSRQEPWGAGMEALSRRIRCNIPPGSLVRR